MFSDSDRDATQALCSVLHVERNSKARVELAQKRELVVVYTQGRVGRNAKSYPWQRVF